MAVDYCPDPHQPVKATPPFAWPGRDREFPLSDQDQGEMALGA
jgi:hypothetical protein